jgi:uncharacterized protein YgbK (DUF1537 family)
MTTLPGAPSYFLADDLSGALDAAAAFHHAGRPVIIVLSPDEWPAVTADHVIGITTETRNVSSEKAAAVVTSVIQQAQRRGARLLYKKIDSTLRGPVAAEVAALATAMPDARLLFAPANPRVGRTVRDGVLLVHGVPVANTEFGGDPVCPVRESSIRALLGHVADSRVKIVDVASEADLTAAVAQMESAGGSWVAIGSGALARPVAMTLRRRTMDVTSRYSADALEEKSRAMLPGTGPILFVCGSAHRANREQAAVLARECAVPLHDVSVANPLAAVPGAVASMRSGSSAALLVEELRSESAVALRAIVSAAHAVISETDTKRLFVTGGETAFALCGALGVLTLTFVDEVEAGLSVSMGESSSRRYAWAVKPGGFGDPMTWVRGFTALRARRDSISFNISD